MHETIPLQILDPFIEIFDVGHTSSAKGSKRPGSSFAVGRPWQLPLPAPATQFAVIRLAPWSTALAYIVFFRMMQRSGAINVMLVSC